MSLAVTVLVVVAHLQNIKKRRINCEIKAFCLFDYLPTLNVAVCSGAFRLN